MTDPLSSVLAGLFMGVALAAAWGHIARPPSLDGERWFKVLLASLMRGRSEQRGEDAETWASTVVECVPYHPAGRDPEAKVASPSTWRPAQPLQEGEAALMEQLARLETKAQRWQHLYQDSEEAIHARLSDPMDLGPDYDLGRWAGLSNGWDCVADWGGGSQMLGTTLLERVGARWILVRGREAQPTGALLSTLSEELGTWAAPVVDAGDLDSLNASLDREPGRVVLVGEDVGALECLRILADRPALRDRVDAVLALSAPLAGVDDPTSPYARARWTDWMAHWFGHAQLDTDCVRQTPYMSLQWLDPTVEPSGVVGLPLSEARFPPPGEGPFPMVEVVDLGPLLVSNPPPPDLTAKALMGVVCGWVLARRSS